MHATAITRNVSLLVALVFAASAATAAEFRNWTDRKGRTVEAKLKEVRDELVILQLKNGRYYEIKKEILSQGDLNYLAEYGGKGAADVDLSAPAKSVAKSVRIDTKQFKKLDKEFVFPGTEISFEVYQTPHFLIMSRGKIRPKDTAEGAERLWQEMHFQHPNFHRHFEDNTRMAIFLVPDPYEYNNIGQWYVNALAQSGRGDAAKNLALTWPKASASGLSLPNDLASDWGLLTSARVFKAEQQHIWKGVWAPFRTHGVAGALLALQTGGVSDFAGQGMFAIATGHKYFKEIQLCEKTETNIIDANAYESDEVVTAGGFNEGKKWAKTLKDLIRKEKVHPDIKALYRMKAINVTPTDLVLCYGFSRYLQSTVGRMANYAKLAERIDTSNAVPEPAELAKIYGFETVEQMLADWKAYMKSSAFR